MHRVGSGTPVVLIHGFQGSARIWAPVIATIAAGGHEVLAPTLAGHRGGPPLPVGVVPSLAQLADDMEAQLDAAGVAVAHLVGNSLGGWVALELARRGRARSVVAFSPGGGWTTKRDLDRVIRLISRGRSAVIRHRDRVARLMRRPRARRLLLLQAMQHGDRVSAGDADELLLDLAGCDAFDGFMAWLRQQMPPGASAYDADCEVLIAWGERDRLIPFRRYGRPLLAATPRADHVTLPGVGHVPMYDDPALVARTVLEVTSRVDQRKAMTRSLSGAESGSRQGSNHGAD